MICKGCFIKRTGRNANLILKSKDKVGTIAKTRLAAGVTNTFSQEQVTLPDSRQHFYLSDCTNISFDGEM